MKISAETRSKIYPLLLVNFQFFLLGFVWNLANVLVALFQETFSLNNFQTSLITSISFFAFFAISYPARLFSDRFKTINTIVIGCLLSALGLAFFIPGAILKSYPLFLAGVFVMFAGATFNQVACNPYVRALGPDKTAASRINFSQGLGGVGAFLTSYIAGGFVLKLFKDDPFQGIIWFYLILTVLYAGLGLLIRFANMPANPNDTLNDQPVTESVKGQKKSAWSFPHFRTGFIVLLLYMGAEAILYQLMTPYFMEEAPIEKARAVDISGLLFLGLMIGRLGGAGMLMKVNPGRLIGWFGALAGLLVIISMATHGYVAIYSITITGFFISIMFATIFSLAVDGLGRFTNEASSYLVMAISGGFFIPLLYGLAADYLSLKTSLIIVLIPLLLASWYGFFGARKARNAA